VEEAERDAVAEKREGDHAVAIIRCRERTEEFAVEEAERDVAAEKREGGIAVARRRCKERRVLFWVVRWNLVVVVVHGGRQRNWILGFAGFFGFLEAAWKFGEF